MPQAAAYEQRMGGEPDTLFQTLSKHPRGDGRLFGAQRCLLEAHGFRRCKPQIAVHVGVGCQVHYEKGAEKDPHARLLDSGGRDGFVGSPRMDFLRFHQI
jgi:hypothetical protein